MDDPSDYELLYEITEGQRQDNWPPEQGLVLGFYLLPHPPADHDGTPIEALEVNLTWNPASQLPTGFCTPQDRANALTWWHSTPKELH